MKNNLKVKPLLIIDDGHGYNTPGKRSPLFDELVVISGKSYYKGDFIKEDKDINEPIAFELQRLCSLYGISSTLLVPTTDDLPLSGRKSREHVFHDTAISTGLLPLLISIHANAHDPSQKGYLEWTPAKGVETFYSNDPKKPENFAFSSIIHKHLVTASGLKDRGLKCKPSMFMVREVKSVSALIEVGFMTNFVELKKILSPEYHHKIAQGIIDAVIEYTDKVYNEL